jgi:hypothetical protein
MIKIDPEKMQDDDMNGDDAMGGAVSLSIIILVIVYFLIK